MSKKLLAALLAVCMVASLLFVPASAAATFDDVANNHWASGAIERWAGYGVLNGNGDGTFAPENSMTRAEFAKMLVNMLGLTAKSDKTFSDVDAGAWYAEVISIAVKAGIINGKTPTSFAPNDPVSFEEAVVMMCRAFGLAETTDGADWSKESIEKLTSLGMIGEGADEHLQVGVDCNRAIVAALADAVVAEYVSEDRAEPITGEIKGVVLVVKGAKAEIKDATLAAPVVAESAQVTLTNTKADAVIVSGKDAAVAADEASSVASVTLAGEAPKADIKGEVGSVTIAEETTGAVVDAPKADAIVNNSAEEATVNGETVEGKTEEPANPENPDDDQYNGSVSGGGDTPSTPSTPGSDVTPPENETHEHTYSETATEFDSTRHAYVCTDVTCTVSKLENHDTTGTDGACSKCNYKAASPSEEVSGSHDASHTFSTTAEDGGSEPTCTTQGTKTYKCATEGCDVTKTVTTPATGHSYDNGVITTAATCNDNGVKTYTCSKCAEGTTGHTKTETILATGAHTWDKGEVTTEPTCIDKGVKTFTCTVCDTTSTSEIPATGKHVFDATKGSEYGKNDDQHWLICATDGCSEASTTKTNHVYNQEENTKCVCGQAKPADPTPPEEPEKKCECGETCDSWDKENSECSCGATDCECTEPTEPGQGGGR